jgi:hypothetical protein
MRIPPASKSTWKASDAPASASWPSSVCTAPEGWPSVHTSGGVAGPQRSATAATTVGFSTTRTRWPDRSAQSAGWRTSARRVMRQGSPAAACARRVVASSPSPPGRSPATSAGADSSSRSTPARAQIARRSAALRSRRGRPVVVSMPRSTRVASEVSSSSAWLSPRVVAASCESARRRRAAAPAPLPPARPARRPCRGRRPAGAAARWRPARPPNRPGPVPLRAAVVPQPLVHGRPALSLGGSRGGPVDHGPAQRLHQRDQVVGDAGACQDPLELGHLDADGAGGGGAAGHEPLERVALRVGGRVQAQPPVQRAAALEAGLQAVDDPGQLGSEQLAGPRPVDASRCGLDCPGPGSGPFCWPSSTTSRRSRPFHTHRCTPIASMPGRVASWWIAIAGTVG